MEREGKNERCVSQGAIKNSTVEKRREKRELTTAAREQTCFDRHPALDKILPCHFVETHTHEHTPRPDKHPAAELFMSENAIIRHTNVSSGGMRALEQHNTHTSNSIV